MLSIAVGGLFFFLPAEIGEAFYPGEHTEKAILILSLVTPFMYVETVSDGLLKAIGEQVQTLKFTVYNSLLRVLLILTFVTKSGENGYLWLLVISNTFTYILCRHRLFKTTGVGPRWKTDVFLPLFCALSGGIATRFFLGWSTISGAVARAASGTCVYIGVFALMLMLFAFERMKTLLKRLRVKND
jgi:stage V sporulation protein B